MMNYHEMGQLEVRQAQEERGSHAPRAALGQAKAMAPETALLRGSCLALFAGLQFPTCRALLSLGLCFPAADPRGWCLVLQQLFSPKCPLGESRRSRVLSGELTAMTSALL